MDLRPIDAMHFKIIKTSLCRKIIGKKCHEVPAAAEFKIFCNLKSLGCNKVTN